MSPAQTAPDRRRAVRQELSAPRRCSGPYNRARRHPSRHAPRRPRHHRADRRWQHAQLLSCTFYLES